MKHASIRETFRYWDERRGARPAPQRDEIEPGAIRKALGDSFLLALDPERGHPFRLAGTRVCALFCRELKGEPFMRLWDAASAPLLRELVDILARETMGLVAGATGRIAGEPPVPFELLLLPLAHGSLQARLLGVLVPIARPYWLGQHRLAPLRLGAFRHLHPAMPSPSLVPPGARRVGGFIVHEGGATACAQAAIEAADS